MKQKRYVREQRTYYFSNIIEVERIYRGKGGGRGRPREKRKKATPEQIARQNQWKKEKNLRRMLLENFKEDDYWALLTYLKGYRTSRAEAKKDFQKFYRSLGREYRKAGYELKWIVRTDVGTKGAAHHHVVINRIPDGDRLVKKCWRKITGAGFPSFKNLYEEGGFKGLAYYLTKPPSDGKEKADNYSRSRNLIVPQPEITRARAADMREYPEPLPGYYIEKESVTMGINPVTGQEYQYFTMVRLERGKVAPVQQRKKEERGSPGCMK